jgi:endonuclease-3
MVPRLQRPDYLGGSDLKRVRPKRAKPRAIKPPDPALRSRARKILARLAKAYPDWGPTLLFTSPLELLVATMLAAQAQDERINQVTRVLFTKYRSPADYAAAPAGVLERDIKATGYYNQKAKSLRAMAQGLLEDFGGEVPSDMEGLTRLRGVGRKTASIVLGAAFGVPAVAVDRHVERVAERLRVNRAGKDIEASLRAIYPKKDWIKATWCFVLHGRRTCRPTPLCPICPINDLCPYPKKTKTLPAGLRSIQRTLPAQAASRRPR